MMEETRFVLNEVDVVVKEDPTKRLLDVLRDTFGLISVKEGCGEGECGACAILVNGQIMNSCVTPLGNIAGQHLVTMEGFSRTKRYQELKEAFEMAGAVQCGACTPGMIFASEALLNSNPTPTEEEIRDGLSGNLCRCTGYNMIVKAIKIATERGDHLW
ncbi:MAG: (2Fe-2S)-binding protein [Vallitaleaceae bacterium]|nr:(2Fe-2S)-binding protein [Vallitaleaceae bacterium]